MVVEEGLRLEGKQPPRRLAKALQGGRAKPKLQLTELVCTKSVISS